jgi:hypothetical protein
MLKDVLSVLDELRPPSRRESQFEPFVLATPSLKRKRASSV